MMRKLLIAVIVVGFAATGGVLAADSDAGSAGVDSDSIGPVSDADVYSTLTGETVTLTLTDDGNPVDGAAVTVDVEENHSNETSDSEQRTVGLTGADGTVTFTITNTSQFDVELSLGGNFSGEIAYGVDNGTLVLLEEQYEYAEYEQEEQEEREEQE